MKKENEVIIRQQGDVVLFEEKAPADAQWEYFNGEVAYGEVTGHCHRFPDGKVQVYTDPKTKTRYLRLVEPMNLTHEEHHALTIPPGEHRIAIVVETDHIEGITRRVAD